MNIKNEVYHNQEIRNNDEIFGRKQFFYAFKYLTDSQTKKKVIKINTER